VESRVIRAIASASADDHALANAVANVNVP